MANIFSKAFWTSTAEAVVVSAGAAFTGSLTFTNGVPSLKSLAVAGIAAGMAALYTVVKAVGGQQAVSNLVKTGKLPASE